MQKEYWDKFYKGFEVNKPSNFALFVDQYLKERGLGDKLIYDIGSGNGRDSVFFSQTRPVVSIDPSGEPWSTNENITHLGCTIKELKDFLPFKDSIVYSRFLLHAITRAETKRLLRWCKGMFIAEFRVKGDKPKIYKKHKRVFWASRSVLRLFDKWDVLYFYKGRGVAKFKDEDPLVVRIIAVKK